MKGRPFNWWVSDVLRSSLKRYYEWSARLKGQRFYCYALAGLSEYNITINCDSTVSCSCQDYDGSGHIGDLEKNNFAEVFFGPTAQRFREEMARGRLPLKTCARCAEVRRVPKAEVRPVIYRNSHAEELNGKGRLEVGEGEAQTRLLAGPLPRLPYRGMLLENTVRCNLDCVGCDRQSAARIRSTPQMDLQRLTRMADLVHELKLKALCYLNLGEPFLSPNIGPEMEILRGRNPECQIWISTNGLVLNTDAKREAALKASRVYFSLAGVDNEMVAKYERHAGFDKAYANMKALVEYRDARGLTNPGIEWKYLLFNWNDRRKTILRAIELAKAAGVDVISFWPTGNPFFGISYRYRLGTLNDIGVASWKGREVVLRGAASAGAKNGSGTLERVPESSD